MQRFHTLSLALILTFTVATPSLAQQVAPTEPTCQTPSDSLLVQRVYDRDNPCGATLPVRSVAGAAALMPGVDREETTDNLSLLGQPADQTRYYLNGLPVSSRLGVPWPAVKTVSVLKGHLPAAYGNATSGLVSVTAGITPSERWQGSVEGLSSEGLDAYGYNEGTLTFSGPITPGIGMFLSGSYRRRGDSTPSAIVTPRLKESYLADLHQNPQVIRLVNESNPNDRQYIPMPADIPEGTSLDDLGTYVNIPAGYRIIGLTDAASFLGEEAFSQEAARLHNEQVEGQLMGHLSLKPLDGMTLGVGGFFDQNRRDLGTFDFTLLPDRPEYRLEEGDWRGYLTLDHQLASGWQYHLQAAYSASSTVRYNPLFSNKVEDVLFYGDIDHEANRLATRYWRVERSEDRLVRSYDDGDSPYPSHGLFWLPGASTGDYYKDESQGLLFSGSVEKALGGHRLLVGGEYEGETLRYYAIPATHFARYYDDGEVEFGNPGITRWEDVPYDLFPINWYGIYNYQGYDFRGLKTANDQSVDAFSKGQNPTLAPFKPVRMSGYLQDVFSLGQRVTLELGVRVDRFSHDSPVLYDPYALLPIRRAKEVADKPANIGDDFAVYYYDYPSIIVGYRDRKGHFFDAQGQASTEDNVRLEGNVFHTATQLTAEVFTDYKPQLVLQPRLAVRAEAWEKGRVSMYYNHSARQPWEYMQSTFLNYYNAALLDWTEVGSIGNANLKPERAHSYGLNVSNDFSVGTLALQLYGRSYKDLVGPVVKLGTYPNHYLSWSNSYDGTVWGAEIAVQTSRKGGFQLAGAYSYQQAKGLTGQPFVEVYTHFAYRNSREVVGKEIADEVTYQDRTHQIKAVLDYRTGAQAGPSLGGIYPLAQLGISLFADIKSGLPYTKTPGRTLYEKMREDRYYYEGQFNELRMPWSYLLNLQMERTFNVGGANLTLYSWIENLLDADNIRGVWSTTGQPDEDGFLDSAEGKSRVEGLKLSGGTPYAESFTRYYNYRLNDPSHFGMPRQIRLGLRVGF